VPGTFAYSPLSGAIMDVGTNSLSVTFTPSDAVDFCNVTYSVPLVVTLDPIALSIQVTGNAIVLTWNDPAGVFTLQAAPSLDGIFTNVPGAVSPYTNSIAGQQQYFRLW
jgi:hypothetical protein